MNKKIIFSLLLISIAFVGIGATAASDDYCGSHRPQLGVSDNVVSDLEGPSIIVHAASDRPQCDRELDLAPIVGAPIIGSDRPGFDRELDLDSPIMSSLEKQPKQDPELQLTLEKQPKQDPELQ